MAQPKPSESIAIGPDYLPNCKVVCNRFRKQTVNWELHWVLLLFFGIDANYNRKFLSTCLNAHPDRRSILMTTDKLAFADLPFSYRMSQGSMVLALLVLWLWKKLAMLAVLKWVVIPIVAAVVLFALATAAYVVIRYPYISLVETRDGDIYSEQFDSRGLLNFLKIVSLIVFGVCFLYSLMSILNAVNLTTGQLLWFVYFGFMFGFCAFMTFVYDPVQHATIATLARSTFGLGLILFPIFLPIVIIGSFRLGRLLGDQANTVANSFHEAEQSQIQRP